MYKLFFNMECKFLRGVCSSYLWKTDKNIIFPIFGLNQKYNLEKLCNDTILLNIMKKHIGAFISLKLIQSCNKKYFIYGSLFSKC